MPFTYSLTIAINGADHGASETMYFQQNTKDLNTAMAIANLVLPKRAALLGSAHFIKAARVQLVYGQSMEKIRRQGLLQKTVFPGRPDQPSSETGVRLQVAMEPPTREGTKLSFLSGPWRSIFPNADLYDGTAGGFQSYFNAWASVLIANNFGWIAKADNPASSIISDYDFDPQTGHTKFTLAPGGINFPELYVPYKVNIEFPLQRSPLDGVQLVIPQSQTEVITAKPRPASPYIVNGKMTIASAQFVGLGAAGAVTGLVNAQNPVGRKIGRPLYISRGRSAAVVRW